jgi:hypothetical protein
VLVENKKLEGSKQRPLASWLLKTLQSWRAKSWTWLKSKSGCANRIEAQALASDLPKGAGPLQLGGATE